MRKLALLFVFFAFFLLMGQARAGQLPKTARETTKLSTSAFHLSDRGVKGRTAPGAPEKLGTLGDLSSASAAVG